MVVFILSGTSQLVSCSYDKNGSPDPQITARNRQEKLLAAATGDTPDIDGWRVCGKLSLSSKYKIHAAAGVQHQQLVHHSDSVDVAISPETGTISCRCRLLHRVQLPSSVDTTNHQVAIEVQIVDMEQRISLPMEFAVNPCQISFCQRNPSPTTLLTIKQRQLTSEYNNISLQLNSECTSMLLQEHSPINVQLMGNGAVALSALPSTNLRIKNLPLPLTHRVGRTSDNSGILLRNQHQLLGQACNIDVTRPIQLTGGIDSPYSHGISFTQLLPLELVNCINLLNDRQPTVTPMMHNVVLLSAHVSPWLSGHNALFARHNSQRPYHAQLSTTSDVIHEKGGHAVSKSATRHGVAQASKIREVRQSSTSPPEFNDTFYMGSVPENSPSGTMVIAVRATGNGQIVYTMTPDSGFSSGLFAMNRTTGVVTTTGLSCSDHWCMHARMHVCVHKCKYVHFCVCECICDPSTCYGVQ